MNEHLVVVALRLAFMQFHGEIGSVIVITANHRFGSAPRS